MNLFVVCYLAICNTVIYISPGVVMVESIETPRCDYVRADVWDDEVEDRVSGELQSKYRVDETDIMSVELLAEGM
jgi:hypothetical protein